jgi:hypothetical protein
LCIYVRACVDGGLDFLTTFIVASGEAEQYETIQHFRHLQSSKEWKIRDPGSRHPDGAEGFRAFCSEEPKIHKPGHKGAMRIQKPWPHSESPPHANQSSRWFRSAAKTVSRSDMQESWAGRKELIVGIACPLNGNCDRNGAAGF